MSLFTDTMTVYNSIGENQWKRTVVNGVQWTDQELSVHTEKNARVKKMVKNITIDFNRNYGNAEYLEPKEFEKLDDKAGYWTLNAENGLDIVALGEITKELDMEYRPKHMRADMECATITAVSDYRNRSFLKHIKVVAE